MDKLTDIFNMCEDECEYSRGEAKEKCPIYKICYIRQVYDKLKDYEDLEEQGLLLRLPCKVGNVVYTRKYVPDGSWCAITDGKIHEAEVLSLGVNNIFSPPTAHLSYENGGSLFFFFSDFGKTVFLTKEEAEAKLREMEE